MPETAVVETGRETAPLELAAPLYAAWQLTNECNFSCLHCIEGSGPGKAFKDELKGEEALRIVDALADAGVFTLALSGGEPLLHPDFETLCEKILARGLQLKVETNGHLLTEGKAAWLRSIGGPTVQVSLDGATRGSHERMRPRGDFQAVLEACRRLRRAGVPLEVNFVPASFNIHEIARAVDLAFSLGAGSFYTGKLMRTGNAVRAWSLLEPGEADYRTFFSTLREKAAAYEGRMRVCYHEMGIAEELKFRMRHPAALFIILPNGKVKLINALPFICGDLKTQSLREVWARFLSAWKDPRVGDFASRLEQDPSVISELHSWIEL